MAKILIQIRQNGQITLPAIARRQANLKEGDTLELTIEKDGSLRLAKMAQAYFWSKRWQAGEQIAQSDIESGQTIRFDNVDDALKFLDGDDCLKHP